MRKIDYIFVHCTASPQNWGVEELRKEFAAKGWQNPGYHYVITADGGVHQILEVEEISNGVHGYNSNAINIAYVGGIEKVNGKLKGVDNRTQEQKRAMWELLKTLRTTCYHAKIMGHRDIWGKNPSKWKKECPCFDAEEEYKQI